MQQISAAFDDLEDMRLFIKRSDKLLPATIDHLRENSVTKGKEMFYEMRRDTDRQRMAADVEIKLRGMYFDRIERSEVTTLLDSIFQHVLLLEDVQFLCQYAPQVLPNEPSGANGQVIWDNICALQQELTQKREASVLSLLSAMTGLYPEQLPALIQEKGREVAKLLQLKRFATKTELVRMSQLTGEATKLFPPDFASLEPAAVIATAKETVFNK